jgi:FkbM family methyltransferase
MPDAAIDRYDPHHLWHVHQQLNAANRHDRIVLREGVDLAIDPPLRQGWMPFCLDPGNAREMDTFIRAARNRRHLLDVGALNGTFSLVFTAREGTEALAVEPSPLALPGLRANCRLNPRHNVRIFPGALGAAEALVRMRHDGPHFIGADLVPQGPEPTMVKVVAGDELLADQRFAPDMIKIDVEGYEHEVLSGLSATLDRFRPDLHVEVHGPWIAMVGGTLDAMFALLKDAGYRVHLMDGQEVDAADADRLRQQMFHVFCTHASTEWADRVRGCG